MSECFWNNVDSEWNVFTQIWNDIIPCVKEIYGNIIHGAPPEQAYKNAVGKDKKLHCKIVKVIMILKGKTFEDEKEICYDKYKVTASDIKLLIDYYKDHIDRVGVSVDGIKIR